MIGADWNAEEVSIYGQTLQYHQGKAGITHVTEDCSPHVKTNSYDREYINTDSW